MKRVNTILHWLSLGALCLFNGFGIILITGSEKYEGDLTWLIALNFPLLCLLVITSSYFGSAKSENKESK